MSVERFVGTENSVWSGVCGQILKMCSGVLGTI